MKKWKHSIITGGGSGLGLGLGLRLLRRGGSLSVLDLAVGEHARKQLDEAAKAGAGQWHFLLVDITDEHGLQSTVRLAIEKFGYLDLAVNSAGIINNKTFAALTSEEFRKVIEVNLFGSFNFAKAVMPHLNSNGRLALVASMAGLISNYGYTAYGTSKFGVVGLATTLRYEYEALGVGITCICPPEVKTPMVAHERGKGNADPISLALKDFAGSLEIDEACDAMLAGIDAGEFLVVPGLRSKLTLQLVRHWPAGFHGFLKFNIRRLLNEQGKLQQHSPASK
jgi:NAD(P)-dependent dehydrogenase (short-subunit alcohol dehydrogenase family)